MEYRIVRNDELYHHGVKGMKWGVRKAVSVAGRLRNGPRIDGPRDKFGRPTSDMAGNRVTYDHNGRMHKVNPPMDTLRNADRQAKKTSDDLAKAYKTAKTVGSKVVKKHAANNAKISYKEAKAKTRAAWKSYSKAYNKAYIFSSLHPVSQYVKKSKNYQKSNDKWEDAINKADAYNAAHREMRAARKAYRRSKRG